MRLELPEKRHEILYSRITKQNKTFIAKTAAKNKISESALVDMIIDSFRKKKK